MVKEKLKVNDGSVKTAGLTDDYKQALYQHIWNGFEAGATKINISFDKSHPVVGGFNGVDFEAIITLEPTIVLAWEEGNKAADISKTTIVTASPL